jgi:hypothetical protein
MKTTSLIAVAALLSSAAALAQQDRAAETEKKVCKTERVTGSRTRVNRICKTQAEWDEIAAATKEGLLNASRQSDTFTGDSGRAYGPAGDPQFSGAAN